MIERLLQILEDKVSIEDLENLKAIVENKNISDAEKLEAAAIVLLPVLREFVDNGGDLEVAQQAAALHTQLRFIAPLFAAQYAGMIGGQGLDGQSLKQMLNVSVTTSTDPVKALQAARKTKEKIDLETAEEQIEKAQKTWDALPARVQDFLLRASGKPLDIAGSVNKRRAWIASHSEEEIAENAKNFAQNIPMDAFFDFGADFLNGVTAQKAALAVNDLFNKVTAKDFADAAYNGVHAALKAMEAAQMGNYTDAVKTPEADKLGASLRKVFNALADSLSDNGLIPDTSKLEQALREMPEIYPETAKPEEPKAEEPEVRKPRTRKPRGPKGPANE